MNFVKVVEEQLRDLGTESRRKHPGVKEAAERAILSLRTLQNKYVVAVRKASRASSENGTIKVAHPTTAIFQNQDVLRPFLLSANYPDVGNKVLNLSLDGIQALLTGNAICRTDGVNVVRILSIQANICSVAIQSKIHGSGSMMGSIGMPTAGSMVNAGVGTISSLGNSILNGFGIKNTSSQSAESQEGANASHEKQERKAISGSTGTVASTIYASNRSLKEDEAISIRILQTLTMIIGSQLGLSEEVLSQCISICLVLSQCNNSESGSTASSIGKVQKRKDGSKSSSSHNAGHSGNIISGSQKVSGAANATLRQIVSTLFDRATEADTVTNNQYDDDSEEESFLQSLALKTMLDLCSLAECKDCSGPFGQALVGHQYRVLPPTQSICFDLLQMILEQHVELFNKTSGVDESVHYFSILNETICPLVQRALCRFQPERKYRWLNEDIDKNNPVPTHPDSVDESETNSLQMILKLTSLASSIIRRYGDNEAMEQQCSNLFLTLARLIKPATDILRDSHEFEDGFVYNTYTKFEQDALSGAEQQESSSLIYSQALWAAAVAIEIVYTLISDEFPKLLPLFSSKMNGEDTESLLSKTIGIVCDFSVVASSCKSAISKVVEASGDQDELYQDNIGNVGKVVSQQNQLTNVFECDINFDVQKIHPTLIGSAREMANYDIGAAVWTSLNCILILWKCIQTAIVDDTKNGDCKTLINECFAPSLAVIQHFLRRCPASVTVCRSSLSCYLFLSRSILPLCNDGDFKREVVLASLCKLTLPSWGKDDSKKFQPINMAAVTLLFRLLNQNPNDIGTDWLVIVACLTQLSRLTSQDLNNTKRVASYLSNIGPFSRNLNVNSLKKLTSSLIQTSISQKSNLPMDSTVKTFGSNLYSSTQKKLQSVKLSTKSADFNSLSYTLILLVSVSEANYQRFHLFGQDVLAHFKDQAINNEKDTVRTFSLDVLSYLMTSMLATNDAKKKNNPIQMDENDLLLPLCDVIKNAQFEDTVELGLVKLKQLIEDSYVLTSAWPAIVKSLSSVAVTPRNNGDWSISCTTAFGCLKLIVDDFYLPTDERTRIALLDCCAAFGSSRYDVNISLTATGMLWSIADQDSSPYSVDHVLSKLAFLSSDDRVEVRNCVVNTLFSCVVGLGQKFTAMQWKGIFTNTIFAVLDQVKEQGALVDNVAHKNSSPEMKSPERYRVSVHHSRDSRVKQWATTQVLTLRGIERVLRQFFDTLLSTTQDSSLNGDSKIDDWFEIAWLQIVEQCLDCSSLLGGREMLDLRLVGVEVLLLCCQSSSDRGFIAADARVGTNMQVVNGALRTVRPSISISSTISSSSFEPSDGQIDRTSSERRRRLFNKAYDALIQFGTFLKENEVSISGREDSGYVDSLHLQVLSKLANGLSQLYLCCKDSELSPECGVGREEGFVELVTLIINMAHGGSASKFLTQAQRQCLDILKAMSMNCSSRAFEVLAHLGSNVILKQNQDDVDTLHSEAGKIISELCASDEVKVVVERTRIGLCARIELPGASGSKAIDSVALVGSQELFEEGSISGFEDKYEQDGSEDDMTIEERTENSQLKEINAELMREVEKLRSQKEILEQQVAVFSEGSAYI